MILNSILKNFGQWISYGISRTSWSTFYSFNSVAFNRINLWYVCNHFLSIQSEDWLQWAYLCWGFPEPTIPLDYSSPLGWLSSLGMVRYILLAPKVSIDWRGGSMTVFKTILVLTWCCREVLNSKIYGVGLRVRVHVCWAFWKWHLSLQFTALITCHLGSISWATIG